MALRNYKKKKHKKRIRRTDDSLHNVIQRTCLYASMCRERFEAQKTQILDAKWNIEKTLGILAIPGAPKSQKLKTNSPRRHPEPLCRTSGVQFLSKNRQGHGMSRSRSTKASNCAFKTSTNFDHFVFHMFF